MEWDAIMNLVDQRLSSIVVCCWIVGIVLKRTPHVPDWTIIYIVTATAILLSGFSIGWGVESVVQGILCGAAAVYGHQLYKQSRKGIFPDDKQTK
ncbi:phage holin family protein [Paenibacillus sp. GCM10027626]|uniref:phage holin family protein n=1 Tax=Paenibacillus sp. GCM10027626 TaxID=3273411 RepID=UPI00363D27AD